MKIIMMLFILSFSLSAKQQREGGGGIGVSCNGNVSTLDLYEAKHTSKTFTHSYETALETYGFEIARYMSEVGNIASYIDEVQAKSMLLTFYKKEIVGRFKEIPQGETLPLSGDATLPIIGPNCKFVQIAFFDDINDTLFLDKKLWNKLSNEDKAALIIHEAVYYQYRRQGVYNSDMTRMVVGKAFTNFLPEPIYLPIHNQDLKVVCGEEKDAFKLFAIMDVKNGKTGVRILAQKLNGQFSFERISGFLEGVDLNEFFLGKSTHKVIMNSFLSKKQLELEFFSNYHQNDKGIDGYGISIKLSEQSHSSWIHCSYSH